MLRTFLRETLPERLAQLGDLALDLRWTWSHEADELWNTIDHDLWMQTQNPWDLLQSVSRVDLEKLAQNRKFESELKRLLAARKEYLGRTGWFRQTYPDKTLNAVAYFSMEFGVGEGLPMYAGGLGILAGDYLKTASDLQVPLIGVGLLYQQGYFRQILNSDGWQLEAFPYNDPTSLPISPMRDREGGWLHVPLELPGRKLWLRVWQAQVGRVVLYLLDANDPLNSPADRGITNKLYEDNPEIRLMQEIVLGICGWRVLQALGMQVDVCHLNEGHTAFAALERACEFRRRSKESFPIALSATRGGNVFTTHTPVAAGFDSFPQALIEKYFRAYLQAEDISLKQLLSLGRKDPENPNEPFNMAYLAMRGSGLVNGVSWLHGKVSRRIFQPLFARWPEDEIPVTHVTNGVHVPSWDSAMADELWTQACGKERWLHTLEALGAGLQNVSDADLWAFRTKQCQTLIKFVRRKLSAQLKQRSADPETIKQSEQVLDINVLTMGFARRFAAYKRPNLLLTDPDRLMSIITNPNRPLQLVVAGKAHPEDEEGKRLVNQFVTFCARPAARRRVVFLEDYDIAIAQQMVQGVDLWLNTPRRPWEACGTSGMKVLVNGGVNVSELDGWWAEAYTPEVGWALGDGQEHSEPDWDAREAKQLYELLEKQIIPDFYNCDVQGIPTAWVARMRASMAKLASSLSSNRMMRDYVQKLYIPASNSFRQRTADGARLAKEIHAWQKALAQYWHEIRFGEVRARMDNNKLKFEVPVYFGELDPSLVAVTLYAAAVDGQVPVNAVMARGEKLHGALNGYIFVAELATTRPADHFTPRVVPRHPAVNIPLESCHISWQR